MNFSQGLFHKIEYILIWKLKTTQSGGSKIVLSTNNAVF